MGSGFIPKNLILDYKTKPGIPNAISDVVIQRPDGGRAYIGFKSYDQGRESFQGTAKHIIVFDEEPTGSDVTGSEIYSEALTRTMTTDGIMITVFTPLSGLSPLVLSFLPKGKFPTHNKVEGMSRWVINVQWDDAPHLSEKDKKDLEAAFLPHEREARTKGIPSIGSGKIYTALESDFVVQPFAIPDHWPKAYGMDVGWKRTAAVFGAYDEHNDTIYIYDEYYGSQDLPIVHTHAIKQRAKDWMYGLIDPASNISSQKDGKSLLKEYRSLDLNLVQADNAVEAGIAKITNRLTAGKIKVMANCQNLLQEYRLYARDKEGRVQKRDDHLMDAWRYLIMSFFRVMRVKPDPDDDDKHQLNLLLLSRSKNKITGY
jgi:phage terminase large subunit-like protein